MKMFANLTSMTCQGFDYKVTLSSISTLLFIYTAFSGPSSSPTLLWDASSLLSFRLSIMIPQQAGQRYYIVLSGSSVFVKMGISF